MEVSPKFSFLQKPKENKHNSKEKGAEIGMVQGKVQCRDISSVGFNVTTLFGESLEIMAMSRHQLKKGKQRYNNVVTS